MLVQFVLEVPCAKTRSETAFGGEAGGPILVSRAPVIGWTTDFA